MNGEAENNPGHVMGEASSEEINAASFTEQVGCEVCETLRCCEKVEKVIRVGQELRKHRAKDRRRKTGFRVRTS